MGGIDMDDLFELFLTVFWKLLKWLYTDNKLLRRKRRK